MKLQWTLDWYSMQKCTKFLCHKHRILSLWNVKLWLAGWFSWRNENYFEMFSTHILALILSWEYWESNVAQLKKNPKNNLDVCNILPCFRAHSCMLWCVFINEYPRLVLHMPLCLRPRGYFQLSVKKNATFGEFAGNSSWFVTFSHSIQHFHWRTMQLNQLLGCSLNGDILALIVFELWKSFFFFGKYIDLSLGCMVNCKIVHFKSQVMHDLWHLHFLLLWLSQKIPTERGRTEHASFFFFFKLRPEPHSGICIFCCCANVFTLNPHTERGWNEQASLFFNFKSQSTDCFIPTVLI